MVIGSFRLGGTMFDGRERIEHFLWSVHEMIVLEKAYNILQAMERNLQEPNLTSEQRSEFHAIKVNMIIHLTSTVASFNCDGRTAEA